MPNTIAKSSCIIDSGATQHMSFERNCLLEYVEFKKLCVVNLGDSRTILAYGKGTCHITADINGHTQSISLRDVLYLPDMEKNLLSVRAVTRLGAAFMFEALSNCSEWNTPYEILFNTKPDVTNLRVFRCVSYVYVPDNKRTKLEAKSKKVIFVGYPDSTKGYKLFDPVTHKFIRSRDVVFVEGKFQDFGEEHSTQTRIYLIEDDVKVNVQDVPVGNERVNHGEPEQSVSQPENHNQRVGATYKENFIREVQNLDAKR